jgi:tellurite resistance protein TerA
MGMIIQKGQKTDVTKNNKNIKKITIGLGWDTGSEFDIDAAAFILNNNGKTDSDNEFVFYNNNNWGNGAVIHSRENGIADKEEIKIEISKIPEKVSKIAFTATIYDFESRRQSFGQIKKIYIRVINGETGEEILRYNIEDNLSLETAIVYGELYRYNGEWKFNPIGSGYNGGLKSLCKDFGVEVEEKQKEAARIAGNNETLSGDVSKRADITNSSKLNIESSSKINLSKIELRKKGDKINLSKDKNNNIGKIIVNLKWSRGEKKMGLFGSFGGSRGIDLDLGCLYELKNGKKGVIQALGNCFGNLNESPYIKLLSDDRTGDSAEGEFMYINGDKIEEIKRIIIYAFIYEGVSNWSQADGVVTVKQNNGPDIVIKLNEPNDYMGMCGTVILENIDNEFRVQKIEQYFKGHRELDQTFNWGMRWIEGSK